MGCPAGYVATNTCIGTETCVQGSNCQSGRAKWRAMGGDWLYPPRNKALHVLGLD